MTSGAGGWRIAIVDTADDMNPNAANALLKMLEEPPSRAMLLLLSNTPGRLLPTIRSRCQRLALRPLEDAALEAELARCLPNSNAKERKALVQIAGGSLGLALRLSDGDGIELARDAARLIDEAKDPDIQAIVTLADRANRIQDGLDTLGGYLAVALSDRIRAKAREGKPHLDRWVTAWEMVNQLTERSVGLNLEPRQTMLSLSRALQAPARRTGTL
jgi:DNA polymerase-3 subunit delta'